MVLCIFHSPVASNPRVGWVGDTQYPQPRRSRIVRCSSGDETPGWIDKVSSIADHLKAVIVVVSRSIFIYFDVVHGISQVILTVDSYAAVFRAEICVTFDNFQQASLDSGPPPLRMCRVRQIHFSSDQTLPLT